MGFTSFNPSCERLVTQVLWGGSRSATGRLGGPNASLSRLRDRPKMHRWACYFPRSLGRASRLHSPRAVVRERGMSSTNPIENDHETCDDHTGFCVRALKSIRACLFNSSSARVGRQDLPRGPRAFQFVRPRAFQFVRALQSQRSLQFVRPVPVRRLERHGRRTDRFGWRRYQGALRARSVVLAAEMADDAGARHRAAHSRDPLAEARWARSALRATAR